jgi:hypothetical protein
MARNDGADGYVGVSHRVYTETERFVTFFYAAAANLILVFSIQNRIPVVITTGVVVFLLFDWLSRIRLPAQIPNRPENGTISYILGKTLLEIVGVAVLVIALRAVLSNSKSVPGLELLGPAVIPDFGLFGVFAIITGLWNVLMLTQEDTPKYVKLLVGSFSGDIVDNPKVKKFKHQFIEIFKNQTERSESDQDSGNAHRLNSREVINTLLLPANTRIVGQLVGIHLSVGNFLSGLFLIISTIYLKGTPVGSLLTNGQGLPLEGTVGLFALVLGAVLFGLTWIIVTRGLFNGDWRFFASIFLVLPVTALLFMSVVPASSVLFIAVLISFSYFLFIMREVFDSEYRQNYASVIGSVLLLLAYLFLLVSLNSIALTTLIIIEQSAMTIVFLLITTNFGTAHDDTVQV